MLTAYWIAPLFLVIWKWQLGKQSRDWFCVICFAVYHLRTTVTPKNLANLAHDPTSNGIKCEHTLLIRHQWEGNTLGCVHIIPFDLGLWAGPYIDSTYFHSVNVNTKLAGSTLHSRCGWDPRSEVVSTLVRGIKITLHSMNHLRCEWNFIYQCRLDPHWFNSQYTLIVTQFARKWSMMLIQA